MKKVYVNFELCNSNKLLERNDTLFAVETIGLENDFDDSVKDY